MLELLAVLVIIAVLALIAVPRYQAHMAKAWQLTLMSQMQALAGQVNEAAMIGGVSSLRVADFRKTYDGYTLTLHLPSNLEQNAEQNAVQNPVLSLPKAMLGGAWQIIATPDEKDKPIFSVNHQGVKCSLVPNSPTTQAKCGTDESWLVR
ncbi:Tfp pilus assembly protein PilE [Moraxella caviae]|nr:Tfp pilus assembly protein PilE [Moraxella caviae]VEW12956.1 Tfp pilus assembly protein PilE [Moraxella caviae]